MPSGPVVFFDGECGLCNRFVKFVIRHNSQKNLRYCWLQSDNAQKILRKNKVVVDMSSIIFMDKNKVYFESEAFLRIMSKLDCPPRLLKVFRVFPRFIADIVYRCIAHRRYKIFGKSTTCEMPKDEHRNLYI